MESVTLLLSGIVGLCLGSFVHVAIYRFSPQKTTWQYLHTITFLRSHCSYCHHPLSCLSLIPVFSWLIQRGRCQHCLRRIPLHYFLMEGGVAIYSVMILFFFHITLQSVILVLLGLIFIILAAIDWRYFLLPNCFTYPLLGAGIITAYCELVPLSLYDSLLGIILGFLLLGLPAITYYSIKRKMGLGGGDIKLLAALGAWVNYSQLPLLLVIASTMGLLHFLFLYLMQSKLNTRIKMIPLGPYLLISAYGLLLVQYY